MSTKIFTEQLLQNLSVDKSKDSLFLEDSKVSKLNICMPLRPLNVGLGSNLGDVIN
jgi:hypothetical protein